MRTYISNPLTEVEIGITRGPSAGRDSAVVAVVAVVLRHIDLSCRVVPLRVVACPLDL